MDLIKGLKFANTPGEINGSWKDPQFEFSRSAKTCLGALLF